MIVKMILNRLIDNGGFTPLAEKIRKSYLCWQISYDKVMLTIPVRASKDYSRLGSITLS